MKKNNLSARSIKFIERNSLDTKKVRNYVISLMENVFEIKNYCFKDYKNYGICLFINDYTLCLDKDFVELKLLNKDKIVNTFYGDSCWYQSLKYLKGKLI